MKSWVGLHKNEEMKTNLRWSSFYEELHKLWLDIFDVF